MAHALEAPRSWPTRSPNEVWEGEILRRQWSAIRSLQTPSWLREAADRISELAHLPANWDSYKASPITIEAISTARRLLSNLQVEEMPTPHICGIADGGVGFHWRIGTRDLELEIEPSGAIRFLRMLVGEAGTIEDGEIRDLESAQGLLNWVLGR